MPRRGSAVYICTDDESPKPDDSDCPNNAAHEPFPKGYLAAMSYADKLMETHTQEAPCSGCGLWKIWTPKKVTP